MRSALAKVGFICFLFVGRGACTPAVAAYMLALEARLETLEEKVGELRYDVRRIRRAA